jgi:hypothetical protein
MGVAEVFCRPAYTMVASSATLVKEKSIYQEEEDDDSDVESLSEDTAFTGWFFYLPHALLQVFRPWGLRVQPC